MKSAREIAVEIVTEWSDMCDPCNDLPIEAKYPLIDMIEHVLALHYRNVRPAQQINLETLAANVRLESRWLCEHEDPGQKHFVVNRERLAKNMIAAFRRIQEGLA